MDIARSQNGSLLIFDEIVIDGEADVPTLARIQSHDHKDHMSKFFTSLANNKYVISHKATIELIKALTPKKAKALAIRNNIFSLDYKKVFDIEGKYNVTLYQNAHVLGSSQILIEDLKTNLRVVYSSDIGPQIIEKDLFIPECDVLIIDSTCGTSNPEKQKDYSESEEALMDLISDNISYDGPIQISGHRGTIEKVILRFIEDFPTHEIYLSKNILASIEVYRKFNWAFHPSQIFGNINEIIPEDKKYIYFCTPSETHGYSHNYDNLHFRLTGLHSGSSEYILKNGDGDIFDCYLTAHASYETTIEYILKTKAKRVIIDKIRGSETRANSLKKNLDSLKDFEQKEVKFEILREIKFQQDER